MLVVGVIVSEENAKRGHCLVVLVQEYSDQRSLGVGWAGEAERWWRSFLGRVVQRERGVGALPGWRLGEEGMTGCDWRLRLSMMG